MISITMTLLFIAACESKGNENINMMMEMLDDPMEGVTVSESMRKSMGTEGVIIKHKKCIANMSNDMFEGMKGEVQESEELLSVTKVSTCPTPYTALCESKTLTTYYYSDAKRILNIGKHECSYFKGKWTANTQGKEVEVKTYKAVFNIAGKKHIFETANNCQINPMIPEMVATPNYGETTLMLKASTRADSGCMFSYSIDKKHYSAEGSKGCSAKYDGRKIIGKAKAKNIHNPKDILDVSFDIECK